MIAFPVLLLIFTVVFEKYRSYKRSGYTPKNLFVNTLDKKTIQFTIRQMLAVTIIAACFLAWCSCTIAPFFNLNDICHSILKGMAFESDNTVMSNFFTFITFFFGVMLRIIWEGFKWIGCPFIIIGYGLELLGITDENWQFKKKTE